MTSESRNRRNTHASGFDHYLQQFRHRFKFRTIAIGIAALMFAAVFITLLTVVLGDSLAYSSVLFVPARIILGLLVAGIVALLLWKPLKRFSRSDGIDELEQRVPALQGRAETYHDLHQRRERSPFTELVGRDAMRTLRGAPMNKLMPGGEVYGPLAAAVALFMMLLWLYSALPLAARAGMAHLWFGWFKSDILPERLVNVAPGDSKIRYGDSFSVNATLEGFQSAYAKLHIREPDGDWNEIEMTPGESGAFDFTLYGVTTPIEYYVSSAFTDSARYSLEVVIPARIESLDLRYHYPEWTGADPELIENGSQIAAVEGTRVEVIFSTDRALQNSILIHDNTPIEVDSSGDLQYTASLIVAADGEYQLADLLDGDRIPLTDKQPIVVLEDGQPDIRFVRPGADWNASPIEEVTITAEATDDFGVERIDLHYSVNGSDWQTIEMDPEAELQHTFYLEDFGSDGESLVPGDIITYYAEAYDREQSISTDMLFIDVRPFDRRFSQSQQAGGGGGSGSQAEQEISQRQKEILVATWNLIREAREDTRTLIKPEDSAALLADLQNTLASQADTLAQRADARQLLDDDPDIARFVEYMKEAATAMRPSGEALAKLQFDQAVKHQQRALQYLKRAESVFNDIRISRNESSGGGGGDAGRDMAEMYELEMDLAKNQYETPDAAQQRNGQNPNNEDDAFDKLKDLARRQQKLAESAQRNEELSMAERWQQERLQREIEELQRELEQQRQQQQQSASNQQQQQSGQQQSGQQQSAQQQGSQQQGGQQQSAQSRRSDSQSGDNQSDSDRQTAEAMEDLQQALEQLRGSENSELNSDERRQALENASRELQQSVDRISQSRQRELQQQLADATARASELSREQRETAEQLRDALERAMAAREQGIIESGLDDFQERELAEQKRRMQRDLEDLRNQLNETAERFAEQTPRTTERLQEALDTLEEQKISELLGISGDMIEEGRAPQAALREQQITDALTRLQNDLLESENLAAAESDSTSDASRTTADASRALQQMREALSDALSRARNGESQQPQNRSDRQSQQRQSGQQQAGDQQQAQSGQSGEQSGQSDQQSSQSGEQPGQSGQPREGQTASSAGQGGSRNGGSIRWGGASQGLDLLDIPATDSSAQLVEEARRELEQTLPDLQGQLSAQMQQSLEQIARDLRRDDNGENDRRIRREVSLLLRQLEQLELALNRSAMEQAGDGIRAARAGSDPDGYSARAAEYFRRLSEGQSPGS